MTTSDNDSSQFDEIHDHPGQPRASMTAEQWLKRDLPEPDCLIGNWMTTTTRALMFAPTGIGKTMFSMATAVASAAGVNFLHWQVMRPATVLLIDGEMSRRLLKQRLRDEVARCGLVPASLHLLSHEDIENFAPLNTPEGQAQIEDEIKKIGRVDLIFFDNIMSLISGDQKDEEGWRNTQPWIRSLTKRCMGQIWIHHTGHEENRSYGTKTREWQMDTVLKLQPSENAKQDVDFRLSFPKARERSPANRADFAEVTIALVNDKWTITGAPMAGKAKVSPLGLKFLDALLDATIGSGAVMHGCPAATIEAWQAECRGRGILDPLDGKPIDNRNRALYSKYRSELVAANYIACNTTMAWTLPRAGQPDGAGRAAGRGAAGNEVARDHASAAAQDQTVEDRGGATSGEPFTAVMGSKCSKGTPCIYCRIADGKVFKIKDGRLPMGNGHYEALHEGCAENWYTGKPRPETPPPNLKGNGQASPFKSVGDCPQNWTCARCGEDGNGLKGKLEKFAVNRAGAKADPLHRECAGEWFKTT